MKMTSQALGRYNSYFSTDRRHDGEVPTY